MQKTNGANVEIRGSIRFVSSIAKSEPVFYGLLYPWPCQESIVTQLYGICYLFSPAKYTKYRLAALAGDPTSIPRTHFSLRRYKILDSVVCISELQFFGRLQTSNRRVKRINSHRCGWILIFTTFFWRSIRKFRRINLKIFKEADDCIFTWIRS